MNKIRLAIIGCGAVSERCHLPTALALDNCEVTMLVDTNVERIERLAKQYKIEHVSSDYREVVGKADAAVVALPHHLHAPVSIELLNKGVHVLVEKPMAMSSAECKDMLEAAKAGQATVAVGLMRRFLHSAQLTKHVIESKMLGKVESFDFREGSVYNWPVSSDFFFKPETAGGGVLFDTGAHTLDLLLWWLGDAEVTGYFDDSYGGVEADCEIRLKSASGVEGIVELSRTRDLRNTALIKCERGTLEVDLRKNSMSLNVGNDSKLIGYGQIGDSEDASRQGFFDLFQPQLEDFVDSIIHGTSPKASGEEAARSVALIESCYQNKKELRVPWMSFEQSGEDVFREKNVLVTGATGFIGGRLVERLFLEKGAKVRALVRNFKNASRIARFPIELVAGDILDEESVSKAAEGCDYIFHCAYDFAGTAKHKEEVSVKGTENVCKAALKHKVKRLVHLSTISVYGPTLDGDLAEESPKQESEDIYTITKLASEDLVLDYCKRHKLPVTVLQPTIVYGPFSRPWTINPVKQMREGMIVLPNNGDGSCNAVYIDDVIDSMLLAATSEEAVGETMLISGSKPVPWKEFYGSLERIIGRTCTISLTDKEVEELIEKKSVAKKSGTIGAFFSVLLDPTLWERIYVIPGIQSKAEMFKKRFPRAYERGLSKFFGIKSGSQQYSEKTVKSKLEENMFVPDRTRYELLRSKTRVRIDKARRLLGYEPKFDLEKGMSMTQEFLKWGDYIP